MHENTTLLAIGVVAPPVTGKTVATEHLFAILQAKKPNQTIIVSEQIPAKGMGRIGLRLRMTAKAFCLAAAQRFKRRRVRAYLVAEGGLTIFFTALMALLLRPLVDVLVVHHHGRYWLEEPNKLLHGTLFRKSDFHITQCRAMSALLKQSYRNTRTFELSNAHLVSSNTSLETRVSRSFNLGHLSNLTIEKGLMEVIETYTKLKLAGANVTLRLGGTPQDLQTQTALSGALADHPEIRLFGFVDAENKKKFFSELDVFLFPSKYKMETEGIVVLEAMAHEVPVIATDLCCLPGNIEGSGGKVVSTSEDFSAAAATTIQLWISSPARHRIAKALSSKKAHSLQSTSRQTLEEISNLLVGTTNPSTLVSKAEDALSSQ